MNPSLLDPITEQQRLALISCFENNSQIKILPQRKFALDLEPALEIVRPIIDGVLGAALGAVSFALTVGVTASTLELLGASVE